MIRTRRTFIALCAALVLVGALAASSGDSGQQVTSEPGVQAPVTAAPTTTLPDLGPVTYTPLPRGTYTPLPAPQQNQQVIIVPVLPPKGWTVDEWNAWVDSQ